MLSILTNLLMDISHNGWMDSLRSEVLCLWIRHRCWVGMLCVCVCVCATVGAFYRQCWPGASGWPQCDNNRMLDSKGLPWTDLAGLFLGSFDFPQSTDNHFHWVTPCSSWQDREEKQILSLHLLLEWVMFQCVSWNAPYNLPCLLKLFPWPPTFNFLLSLLLFSHLCPTCLRSKEHNQQQPYLACTTLGCRWWIQYLICFLSAQKKKNLFLHKVLMKVLA